jgi:hypothetical protein
MTDRLDCPNCAGTGEQRLGPLRLLCTFCRGLGYVGDDNEPAERNDDADEEAHPMTEPPVWQHPATEGLPGCRVCFGSGRVVNLGGDVRGGTPSRMVEAPCPACSG